MGVVVDRVRVVSQYLYELARGGVPQRSGDVSREVVFILDGVGGFQFVPLLLRRAWRDDPSSPGTILFKWQFGVPGEIWTDLCWRSRNLVKAGEFADLLAAFHDENPDTRIHLVGYSGGTGIAVWACERLASRAPIETMVLACPALSPAYNLAPALGAVRRCYALVSHRDWGVLGAGTTVFGTVDRLHCSAAGRLGFRLPDGCSDADRAVYDEKFRQIRWSTDLRQFGNSGGHTGWAQIAFLREYMLGLLRGDTPLPVEQVR
jgi:pimeloyl-ACP methyl ester carboxylesterase